jgi:hypothetical protein
MITGKRRTEAAAEQLLLGFLPAGRFARLALQFGKVVWHFFFLE